MKHDLSEELATVRALLAENGAPVLTEDILKQAASEGAVFAVGELVAVLNPWRLPKVEEVRGTGIIEHITTYGTQSIYWVSGFSCGRSARVLRRVEGA